MPLKILFLEDNEPVAKAVSSALEEGQSDFDKVAIRVADTVASAVDILSAEAFDLVLVDALSESGKAMDIIDRIAAIRDQGTFFKLRGPVQIPAVVIRHSGQTVPSDTSVIKGSIGYPFSKSDLVAAIKGVFPDRSARRSADAATEDILEKMKIVPGGAYIVVSDKVNGFRSAVKSLSGAGSPVLLLTPSPNKVAKERIGLDLRVSVVMLSGSRYQLGTHLRSIVDFVRSNADSVVVVDDLCDVVSHCGLDRTMRFLKAVVEEKSETRFTFLTVARESDLGQGGVNVVRRVLKPCYFED